MPKTIWGWALFTHELFERGLDCPQSGAMLGKEEGAAEAPRGGNVNAQTNERHESGQVKVDEVKRELRAHYWREHDRISGELCGAANTDEYARLVDELVSVERELLSLAA